VRAGPAVDNLTDAIVEICRSGVPPHEVRDRVLPRLRRVVPFDAAFWTTVDPATLLFTAPHQEGIPADTIPYFLHNEYLEDDVNKWMVLARDRAGIHTLAEVTGGNLEASARYRDIFRPGGFGDELRAVLRLGGACWGCVCLHREAGAPFAADEVEYVRRLLPRLAEGIRASILTSAVERSHVASAPGLLVLAPDGSLVSTTTAGEQWLQELGHPDPARYGVPAEIQALVAMLRRPDAPESDLPRLRMRTGAGRWAVLHASRLASTELDAVAVIIEEPSPAEIGPVLMLAYGLTRQEQAVTQLVCRGLSTRDIAERLTITTNTVQDHLKSIFDKTGVRSRRELVTAILQEQYLPRAIAGGPVAPSGFFAT
jgi:DNA-binding CsgD family transcriptional regulator